MILLVVGGLLGAIGTQLVRHREQSDGNFLRKHGEPPSVTAPFRVTVLIVLGLMALGSGLLVLTQ